MQKILASLNETPGILGSFVVDEGGMIVLSEMKGQLDDEAVGALASAIVHTVGRARERLNQGECRNVVLETESNKLILSNSVMGTLVAVSTRLSSVGLLRLEMQRAVRALNASKREG